MLGTEITVVQERISSWSFLTIDSNSGEVSFISRAFSAFAKRKLLGTRNRSLDRIISDLSRDRTNERATASLPAYFEQTGQLKEIVALLSPDHFNRLIEQKHSFVPVYQQIKIGINAARETQSNGELLRFVLQQCLLKEMETTQGWRSEIEAIMALQDSRRAIAIAQQAITKEDRLQLFSVVAKCIAEQGKSIPEEITNQIRMLYTQIEAELLGERAVDIAADLLHSCPDLAMNLVERAAAVGGQENALDLAYARLSLTALSRSSFSTSADDKLEIIRNRIRDPRLRSFA
jgi:hypothetical protein